jgi:hypothetical protein
LKKNQKVGKCGKKKSMKSSKCREEKKSCHKNEKCVVKPIVILSETGGITRISSDVKIVSILTTTPGVARTGTVTIPFNADFKSISVQLWAGGGGGGSPAPDNLLWSGSGGGSGSYLITTVPVSPGQIIPFTVGSGGIGGDGNGTGTGIGAPGTATIFGSLTTVGGLGGLPSGISVPNPTPSQVSPNGISIAGESGGSGAFAYTVFVIGAIATPGGGRGGSAPSGGRGGEGSNSVGSAIQNGLVPGGGGGGSGGQNTLLFGGNGADGGIFITYNSSLLLTVA